MEGARNASTLEPRLRWSYSMLRSLGLLREAPSDKSAGPIPALGAEGGTPHHVPHLPEHAVLPAPNPHQIGHKWQCDTCQVRWVGNSQCWYCGDYWNTRLIAKYYGVNSGM